MRGMWVGVYGSLGYTLPLSPSGVTSLPAGITGITNSGTQYYGGLANGLGGVQQIPPGTDQESVLWYGDVITLGITATDSTTRLITLYLYQSDNDTDVETVEFLDGATVLDSRDVTNYKAGSALTWQASGSLTIRITKAPANRIAVCSGLLFDPAESGSSFQVAWAKNINKVLA